MYIGCTYFTKIMPGLQRLASSVRLAEPEKPARPKEKTSSGLAGYLFLLFVMCPHTKDLYCFAAGEYLINKTMLNVDSAGISSCQVAHEFFKRRRILERVLFDNIEEQFRFGSKPRCRKLLGIFLGLLCKDEPPTYHFNLVRHFLMGVLMPLRIDSRIPGIERR